MKALSAAAIEVLGSGLSLVGHNAKIATKLDSKLYVEVNSALEALGGKWNRKAQAHVFSEDPADALDQVLVDGGFHDKKRDLDQFFTPPELAKRIVTLADVRSAQVLEPSAGTGALVLECLTQGARRVVSVEKDEKAHEALCWMKYPNGSHCPYNPCDFMAIVEDFRYDRVVMNPPFSRQQDIDHVTKAFGLLASGGKLVAIMSAGVEFRTNRKAVAFRELVAANGGSIEKLPSYSFKASGTSVNTVLVTMRRP